MNQHNMNNQANVHSENLHNRNFLTVSIKKVEIPEDNEFQPNFTVAGTISIKVKTHLKEKQPKKSAHGFHKTHEKSSRQISKNITLKDTSHGVLYTHKYQRVAGEAQILKEEQTQNITKEFTAKEGYATGLFGDFQGRASQRRDFTFMKQKNEKSVLKGTYSFAFQEEDYIYFQVEEEGIKKGRFSDKNKESCYYAKFPLKPFLVIPYTAHMIELQLIQVPNREIKEELEEQKGIIMQLELFCAPQRWGSLKIHKISFQANLEIQFAKCKWNDIIMHNMAKFEERHEDDHVLLRIALQQHQICAQNSGEKSYQRNYYEDELKPEYEHYETSKNPCKISLTPAKLYGRELNTEWDSFDSLEISRGTNQLTLFVEQTEENRSDLKDVLGVCHIDLLKKGFLIDKNRGTYVSKVLMYDHTNEKYLSLGSFKIEYTFQMAKNALTAENKYRGGLSDSSFIQTVLKD